MLHVFRSYHFISQLSLLGAIRTNFKKMCVVRITPLFFSSFSLDHKQDYDMKLSCAKLLLLLVLLVSPHHQYLKFLHLSTLKGEYMATLVNQASSSQQWYSNVNSSTSPSPCIAFYSSYSLLLFRENHSTNYCSLFFQVSFSSHTISSRKLNTWVGRAPGHHQPVCLILSKGIEGGA